MTREALILSTMHCRITPASHSGGQSSPPCPHSITEVPAAGTMHLLQRCYHAAALTICGCGLLPPLCQSAVRGATRFLRNMTDATRLLGRMKQCKSSQTHGQLQGGNHIRIRRWQAGNDFPPSLRTLSASRFICSGTY